MWLCRRPLRKSWPNLSACAHDSSHNPGYRWYRAQTGFHKAVLLLRIFYGFFVPKCVCYAFVRDCLSQCALWSPAGKGLISWLSFVVSDCEFVTFPLLSWVRCGTWLYRFLIFAPLLTFTRPLTSEPRLCYLRLSAYWCCSPMCSKVLQQMQVTAAPVYSSQHFLRLGIRSLAANHLEHCPEQTIKPVQGKSPPVQVKEPYGNLDMVTCRLSSCNRSVQSTPADNRPARMRVRQYRKKEANI